MLLHDIVNTTCNTDYSSVEPVLEIEKVAKDCTNTAPVDLIGIAGELCDVDDYELNDIEKLAAAAYLLENEELMEKQALQSAMGTASEALGKTTPGKALALGLILGWLASKVMGSSNRPKSSIYYRPTATYR